MVVKAPGMDGVTRTLRLDAGVDLGGIRDDGAKTRFREWMSGASASIGVGSGVAGALKGAVFEVRQGYKSKDSKRQTADMVNAAMAYTREYPPCIVALSAQIDSDILRRYREKWVVMRGPIPAFRIRRRTTSYVMWPGTTWRDFLSAIQRRYSRKLLGS